MKNPLTSSSAFDPIRISSGPRRHGGTSHAGHRYHRVDADRASARREVAVDGGPATGKRDRTAGLHGERRAGIFDDRLSQNGDVAAGAQGNRREICIVQDLTVDDVGRVGTTRCREQRRRHREARGQGRRKKRLRRQPTGVADLDGLDSHEGKTAAGRQCTTRNLACSGDSPGQQCRLEDRRTAAAHRRAQRPIAVSIYNDAQLAGIAALDVIRLVSTVVE